MADKREDILARLVTVAEGIDGIKTVVRNRGQLTDLQRPAIIILDADEAADDNDPMVKAGLRRVGMNPEIFILLSGKAEDVGPEINAMRAKLVKAILTDTTLQNLTLDKEGIRYEACATGLAMGRSMEGEMGVSFTFTYLLNPADL